MQTKDAFLSSQEQISEDLDQNIIKYSCLEKWLSSLQGIEANSKLLLKDNNVSFYSNEIICKLCKSNHFLWKI